MFVSMDSVLLQMILVTMLVQRSALIIGTVVCSAIDTLVVQGNVFCSDMMAKKELLDPIYVKKESEIDVVKKVYFPTPKYSLTIR